MFIPRKAQVLIQYNTKRGYKPWRGCPRPHKKPTNNTFDALRLGRSSQFIVAWLLRFWDSENIKKYGKFMGITLLLLDEKIVSHHTARNHMKSKKANKSLISRWSPRPFQYERDYVPLSSMAWPKTSLITDDAQQGKIVCLIWSIDSHVTRSVSILGLSSGPLDLTEKSKWGNKAYFDAPGV
uniref:Uncharacterized protein n=1 Tax=Brassica oleracea var. oleracea TaxID=109376 RepID=A0A0D3CL42_BRAOL